MNGTSGDERDEAEADLDREGERKDVELRRGAARAPRAPRWRPAPPRSTGAANRSPSTKSVLAERHQSRAAPACRSSRRCRSGSRAKLARERVDHHEMRVQREHQRDREQVHELPERRALLLRHRVERSRAPERPIWIASSSPAALGGADEQRGTEADREADERLAERPTPA